MTYLSPTDHDKIYSVIRQVHQSRSTGEFFETLLRSVQCLMPTSNWAFTEVDLGSGLVTGQFSNPELQETARLNVHTFEEHLHEHPIVPAPGTKMDRPVIRIGDVLPLKEWKARGIYQNWFTLFDATRQMVCEVSCDADSYLVLTAQRSGRDFTDREVRIMETLRPHVEDAYQMMCYLQNILQQAADLQSIEMIADQHGRRIGGGSHELQEQNRTALQQWFNTGAFTLMLPTQLRVCLNQHLRVSEPLGKRSKFQITVSGRDLTIEISPADRWQRHRMVVTYSVARECCGTPDRVGLSPREFQTIQLVADKGLTNQQVAESLGIGIESVKTYLSRVYVKLNVHNRVSAVSEYLRRRGSG